MKKTILLFLVLILCACSSLKDLPSPELESGIRGSELGIDKNINENTIDEYLNRSDSVYIDCRLLEDEANFEDIGGDSILSGYVDGFEIIPYPYLCNITDMPQEIKEVHLGPSLFTLNDDGTYKENYEESIQILNELFPKNKTIFLMCGGGGYANKTKQLLIAYGYNENKIYNVGGYWYYNGNNSISTLKEDGTYEFTNVPIHNIDFESLNAKDGYDPNNIIHVDPRKNNYINKLSDYDSLKLLLDKKESFALLISLKSCTTCAEFRPIVNEFAKDNELKVYEISIDKIENYLDVKYTPSLQLYIDGKLIKQLEPTSDDDIKYYNNIDNLKEWFNQ